ncbi:hypothetical protein RUM43_011408, partial [Polyplax serrata]
RDRLEEFEGNTKTRSRTLEVPEKKTSGESSTKRQYGRTTRYLVLVPHTAEPTNRNVSQNI